MIVPFILISVGAYLLGSIPFGLLIGKLCGVDLREHGSRNIGATNAFRVLGKGWGVLTFVLDAGKGLVAVRLAMEMGGSAPEVRACAGIVAAVCAILGHNFPVWLGFKGGKGVATSLGVVIGLVPIAAAISFGVWLVVLVATRYVSVASMVAATAVPIAVAFLREGADRIPLLAFSIAASLLILVRHKANIQRLRAGTENRFGKRKESL